MSIRVRSHVEGAITPPYVLARSDRLWLGSAVGAAALVYLVYLLTHPMPAYGAGLYLEIAEQISAAGYDIPRRIPGYTGDGVPFAYPPLFFYVAAVVRDLTGMSAIEYSRLVPGFFTVLYVIPFYFAAREILESTPKAGLATIILATAPATLQWHLSAGGIVRSGAFLLTMIGLYTGVKLFKTGDRVWLAVSAGLFGLTVLSHPVYAVFFGTNYLLLFLAYDRSLSGLLNGAAVALGGLIVASPWLLYVIQVHGLDVFTSAAGTHGGIGEQVDASLLGRILPTMTELVFYTLAGAIGIYLLSRGWLLLPVWFGVLVYMVEKPRFLLVPGAMMTAVLLLDVVAPAIERRVPRHRNARTVVAGAVTVTIAIALGAGLLFAAGGLNTHGGTATQPAFIDEYDREAMTWIEAHSSGEEDFVVLGDAAEWFPHFTDRTILLGPWGVEWETPAKYEHHLSTYKDISHCKRAVCVTNALENNDLDPTYVYVPKGEYTVRGFVREQAATMRPSMVASDRYTMVFENEGVMVFRVNELDEKRPESKQMRQM